jgi:drug/metabolite transporter (DMT)-like permease
VTKERGRAIVITIIILILMSFGSIFSKMALKNVRLLTMVWLTVAIGMIAMSIYTFVIRKERIPPMSRQIWLIIIAIGFFNFVTGRIASMYALSLLPATTSTYLSNFIGFLTMGMSILILKETPTVFQVLGAVVALMGLRVFFQKIPAPSELLGVLLIAISITGIAYTNNIARKLAIVTKNSISNNIISTLAILIGGSITVIVGLIFDRPIMVVGWQNWAIIFYLGIVSIAVGLTVWNNILRVLRSYEASILGASTVIWTAILAVPFLGERLNFFQIIGICLMLAGLILVQIRGGKFSELFKRLKRASTDE